MTIASENRMAAAPNPKLRVPTFMAMGIPKSILLFSKTIRDEFLGAVLLHSNPPPRWTDGLHAAGTVNCGVVKNENSEFFVPFRNFRSPSLTPIRCRLAPKVVIWS